MKRFCVFLLVICCFNGFAKDLKKIERPKLVVGIVVDQMRWDYLYRYYDRYGDNGFKRLIGEGFSCQNTLINYLPSFTAPGHSCIYTGSVPSIHGMVGNDWVDNLTGRHWYCVDDTAVTPVNGSSAAGMMSPRNLLTTTMTDELRLATNFKSRVYGVALKDRGSILPGGHLANAAYWFDDSTGSFITSSYYTNTLPGWLLDFNRRHLADSMLRKNWELLYPLSTYTQSLQDNNSYEGSFKGESTPVFPHVPGSSYTTLRYLPAGNALTIKMAEACMAGEALGQQGSTDFLCVSLSSTDYAGHQFGPNSVEIEDMYLRLDQELAGFLQQLDQEIGKGNYVLFLTADHGAAHNSQYLNDIKIPGGNAAEGAVMKDLNGYLKKTLGEDGLVKHMMNYQVYLDEEKIKSSKVERGKVKATIIDWLQKQPEVAYAVDMEDMNRVAVPETISKMIANGYNHLRSGCIQVVLNPGWYSGYAPTGTTHGTWNPYDTHIPLLWYGWHIPAGETHRTIYMTDIAATMTALLHIQMPNGCIGNVIGEIVK